MREHQVEQPEFPGKTLEVVPADGLTYFVDLDDSKNRRLGSSLLVYTEDNR